LLTTLENEKGAGASPLFYRTDPPKPKSQSRLGFGHPGKPILLLLGWKIANGVPGMALFSIENQVAEIRGVRGWSEGLCSRPLYMKLQNLTGEFGFTSNLWEIGLGMVLLPRSDKTGETHGVNVHVLEHIRTESGTVNEFHIAKEA
jgi:hypothetical protein